MGNRCPHKNATNMVVASETTLWRCSHRISKRENQTRGFDGRKHMQGGKAACEGKSTEGFCGWKRTYARRVYEWRVMPWKKFCKRVRENASFNCLT